MVEAMSQEPLNWQWGEACRKEKPYYCKPLKKVLDLDSVGSTIAEWNRGLIEPEKKLSRCATCIMSSMAMYHIRYSLKWDVMGTRWVFGQNHRLEHLQDYQSSGRTISHTPRLYHHNEAGEVLVQKYL